MDKVIKNKRGPELVALQVTKKERKNFFVSYVLSDQVWWCNIKRFLSYSKNYTCKFSKPIHDIIHYSTFTCLLESGKCGKEGENYKNLNILRTKRAFSIRWNYSFWRAIIWWKIKNLIKNSGHKLKHNTYNQGIHCL